jgi:hypothetical protein
MNDPNSLASPTTFHDLGYCGPHQVLTASETARYAAGAWAALGVDPQQPGPSQARFAAWHQQYRWAWELATNPTILDRVEAILGPDLVLWAMFCWYKQPRTGKAIPWHQDASYWPISPAITCTAWVALAPTTRANGCLRVIPRSQHQMVEHGPIQDGRSWFSKGACGIDEATAVDCEMDPGQAVFFSEATLHGSQPNDSDLPRLACSLRYATPEVHIDPDGWGPDSDRIRTYLVRGEDRYHLNDALRGRIPTA